MNAAMLSAVLDKTEKIGAVDAVLLAVIGIAIVFVLLIVLMFIVWVMGKIFDGSEALKQKHPEWGEKLANTKNRLAFWKKKEKVEPVKADEPLAEGTWGELKLINTSERDAAMIMAIVADSTGTPLNELRFKSIKKVEGDEEK